MDFLVRQAVAHGLGDGEHAVGGGLAEGCADGVLVVAFTEARHGDFREAVEVCFQRAQSLLEAFLEGAADGHCFAHRLHGGGEVRLGAGELLESKARDLGDDVIDRRLERGGRDAGDVVVELIQRVADGEAGGHLGDGEARGLGGQRRGA